MRCYCNTLRISYKDHVTKKELCFKIQQAIRPHEDLGMVMSPVDQVWPKPSSKAQ